MPEPREGWTQIRTANLVAVCHPNRPQDDRPSDDIVRTTISVGVHADNQQRLRFDPFSKDAHYHILSTGPGDPNPDPTIPFELADGQTPVDAALEFFEQPHLLRAALERAGEGGVAAMVTNEESRDVARQIREVLGIEMAAA